MSIQVIIPKGIDTRTLILARIEKMRDTERGFPKSSTRWRTYEVDGKHISEIDFNSMDDITLVDQFEMLLFKYYKQI